MIDGKNYALLSKKIGYVKYSMMFEVECGRISG